MEDCMLWECMFWFIQLCKVIQNKIVRYWNLLCKFGSLHPLVHKLSVIRTLFHRANTVVSDPSKVTQEKEYVKSALKDWEYPDWAFVNAQKQSDKQAAQTGTDNRSNNKAKVSVGIPYVQGLSERVKKTLKPYGVTTYFKPYNKLRQKLVNVKDKQPKEKRSHIVYGIKCEDPGCQESYIDEASK